MADLFKRIRFDSADALLMRTVYDDLCNEKTSSRNVSSLQHEEDSSESRRSGLDQSSTDPLELGHDDFRLRQLLIQMKKRTHLDKQQGQSDWDTDSADCCSADASCLEPLSASDAGLNRRANIFIHTPRSSMDPMEHRLNNETSSLKDSSSVEDSASVSEVPGYSKGGLKKSGSLNFYNRGYPRIIRSEGGDSDVAGARSRVTSRAMGGRFLELPSSSGNSAPSIVSTEESFTYGIGRQARSPIEATDGLPILDARLLSHSAINILPCFPPFPRDVQAEHTIERFIDPDSKDALQASTISPEASVCELVETTNLLYKLQKIPSNEPESLIDAVIYALDEYLSTATSTVSASDMRSLKRSANYVTALLNFALAKLTGSFKSEIHEALAFMEDDAKTLERLKYFLRGEKPVFLFLSRLRECLMKFGFARSIWPDGIGRPGPPAVKAVFPIDCLSLFGTLIIGLIDDVRSKLDLCEADQQLNLLENEASYFELNFNNDLNVKSGAPASKSSTEGLIEHQTFKNVLLFDWTHIKNGLHNIQAILGCLAATEYHDEHSETLCRKRQLVEELICAHLLIGSTDAISIARSILSRYLPLLSLPAIQRCFNACSRSPIAAEFCSAVEVLYSDEAPGDKATIQRLRDQIWPLIIECRVQLKMFREALELLEAYTKKGMALPDHMSPSVVRLGLECSRFDLVHQVISKNPARRESQVSASPQKRRYIFDALKVLNTLEHSLKLGPAVDAYNAVVEACVGNNDIRAAEALFGYMKERSILNNATFKIIIKALVSGSPPQLQSALQVKRAMESYGFLPDGVCMNSLFTAAVILDDMSAAWSISCEMISNNLPLSRSTISVLVRYLRPSSTPQEKLHVIQLLDSFNILEDSVLLGAVVDACTRSNDTRRLRQILQKFAVSNMRPSVHTYGTLIKAYGKCKMINEVKRLWEEMGSINDMKPTNYTYGCMYNALISNGKLLDGIKLLEDAIKQGHEPNTVQYSILIKGCAQEKELDSALRLYSEMQERGVECNEITFNTLINTCATAGDMMAAQQVLNDMIKSAKSQPDVITFSTLIKGFCDRGCVNEAYHCFLEMEAQKIEADSIVYNTLLEGYAKKLMLQQAEMLFQIMVNKGVSPSSFTLTILIKLYGRMRRLDEALRLADELPVRFSFQFDAYVYTALFAACLVNSNLDKALFYFKKMNLSSSRVAVTGRMYGTIIVGCIKSLRLLTGYKLLEDAYSRRLYPDISVITRLRNTIIRCQDVLIQSVNRPNILVAVLPKILENLSNCSSKAAFERSLLPSDLVDVPQQNNRRSTPTSNKLGQGPNKLGPNKLELSPNQLGLGPNHLEHEERYFAFSNYQVQHSQPPFPPVTKRSLDRCAGRGTNEFHEAANLQAQHYIYPCVPSQAGPCSYRISERE